MLTPDRNHRAVGFNVIGHVSGNLGLGVTARLFLKLLLEKGFPVAVLDIDPGHGRWKHDLSFEALAVSDVADLRYPINLFILSPLSLQMILPRLRAVILQEARINVGLPQWELPVIPKAWYPALEFLDVVLATSPFIRGAYERSLSNVLVVPAEHPVAMPNGVRLDRGRYGMPGDAVVFVTAFEPHSDLIRKNPAGVIRSFITAFGSGCRHQLLIRINNALSSDKKEHPAVTALRGLSKGYPGIRFFLAETSYSDVLSLYASADVLVSLHRSEGLGLVPLEGMTLGKPVIATAWSGNMAYMSYADACLVNYDLVPVKGTGSDYEKMLGRTEATWAEPDLATAARWMRLLAEDARLRARYGDAAKTAARSFDQRAQSAHFVEELLPILERRTLLCKTNEERRAKLRQLERRQLVRKAAAAASRTFIRRL
jgi:glycosyltransferase involved in cell wall biosynthesis